MHIVNETISILLRCSLPVVAFAFCPFVLIVVKGVLRSWNGTKWNGKEHNAIEQNITERNAMEQNRAERNGRTTLTLLHCSFVLILLPLTQ